MVVCGACGFCDAQPSTSISDDPAMRLILPVGQSVYAIIAGYLGLFSLIFLPAPLAILFGILGLRDIKKNPKLGGWGRSMFGLVMGVIFTVIPAVLILIAVVSER
jgi:Domain of unknown function (DUF4190)